MTALTFLGASGGSGTTTLAALSVALLGAERGAMPVLSAENPIFFAARVGVTTRNTTASTSALIDGGRYRTEQASVALNQGTLVVVGTPTRTGLTALDSVLTDIAAHFGDAGVSRTVPVLIESFGRPASGQPTGSARALIPFDKALAPGGPVSDAFASLSPRTVTALRAQWLPLLQTTYRQQPA